MIKLLMILYIALHLVFSPVASAFASTVCSSTPTQSPHQKCNHHQTLALQQQEQDHNVHGNCHDAEQGSSFLDRCHQHCLGLTTGLVNTFSPPLVENAAVLFIASVATPKSATDSPPYKPPRA